jgi:alpha-L-rhamnosidase
MNIIRVLSIVCMLWWLPAQSGAQEMAINPSLLNRGWPASWITCPGAAQREYGVYHFRKSFRLDFKPDKFVIHVSADNRYRLFVNGHAVCSGPARGDLYNWYFETVDIATYLQAGDNTLAALVWNMGVYAPVAQVSNQTAFVLQGDGNAEQAANSDRTWKVMKDSAYHPCSTDNGERLHTYMVTGPGDEVKGAFYPWGWEQAAYSDASWAHAEPVSKPVPAGVGTDNLWTLAPRTIPLMEETVQRIPVLRRSEGIDAGIEEAVDAGIEVRVGKDGRVEGDERVGFLSGGLPLRIGTHKTVRLLLDQTFNTVAYPEMTVSGGKGASVKLSYAESLFKNGVKGNRNEIAGKVLLGNYDVFVADGGPHRLFRPLWVRAFRYLQLDITTGDESLLIEDLHGIYTGYPFERKATFSASDSSLREIWDVGWRTARLCAGETYFDCPYYEQLQYEADTRIQCLISLYATGDDRLMRKALLDFYHSRVPEGLTQGRYPSNRLQVIPPFSLWWVSMLHDYWMHRKDDGFIGQFLPAVRGVLDWYEAHIDSSLHMLGPMPWWGFVDWADAFAGGVPKGATDGHSSVITLQYVYTLQQASELFDYFGGVSRSGQDVCAAAHYRDLASGLGSGVYRQCWDAQKGEMGNTPEKTSFSQHAGIMGILAGAIPVSAMGDAMRRILADSSLEQATFYYRFYLTQAMKAAGLGDLYYSQLTPWRNMLRIGLTTFAEKPEPTRSDCHAWSASPEYDFLATICGIMPDAPGFSRVLIRPAMGELREVRGSMPHPAGMIMVHFKKQAAGGIEGEVTLPDGLTGKLVYRGKAMLLKGGKQEVNFDGPGAGPGGAGGGAPLTGGTVAVAKADADVLAEKADAAALRVIFDTDMGPDYDDVGAITLLHAFADSGKARILATMASNKYEGVAAVLNLFNTYFHRPEIPIGVPKGDAVNQRDAQHWTDSILAKYPHVIRLNADAFDAVTLYRKVLARQPDHSVVIVTVGFLTNLAGLLQSRPDSMSRLDGVQLVKKKVRRLVSMAGSFPEGREFNVFRDSAASGYVFDHWPTPILFSGVEIGRKIKSGLPLVQNTLIQNSPVKDVFRISLPQAAEDGQGRSSWDETAVLIAIAGIKPWYSVRQGVIHVLPDGSNTWEASAFGKQGYIIESRPASEVQEVINALIMHQPL